MTEINPTPARNELKLHASIPQQCFLYRKRRITPGGAVAQTYRAESSSRTSKQHLESRAWGEGKTGRAFKALLGLSRGGCPRGLSYREKTRCATPRALDSSVCLPEPSGPGRPRLAPRYAH